MVLVQVVVLVVVNALAHGVVHDDPVVLIARRPDLETIRARMLEHLLTAIFVTL